MFKESFPGRTISCHTGEPEPVGDGIQPGSEDHTAPAMKWFSLELHLPLDSQAVGYCVLPEALGQSWRPQRRCIECETAT